MSLRAPLSPTGRPAAQSDTLKNYVTRRMEMLCRAAGYPERSAEISGTLRSLIEPWAEQAVSRRSAWVSDIADDNTPVEFSVAIADNDVEVRALFETQANEPTMEAFRAAGLAFQDRLEREFGATLERLRRVQDLFLPTKMQGEFAIWNAVVFDRDGPKFKAYLNPQAQGYPNSGRLIREALARLEIDASWDMLEETILARGPELDELKYFALDLTEDAHSRVKIYVRHHEVTSEELERAASAAETYVPGETQDFARAMGPADDLLAERAAFTCSSFIGGSRQRPQATTVYVPVCAYSRDDAAVLKRVSGYLRSIGVDPSRYEAVLRGFANRPLEDGVGMQPWAAFRRHGGVRLTAYLATEAYHVHQPGTVPAPTKRQSGTRRVAPRLDVDVDSVGQRDGTSGE